MPEYLCPHCKKPVHDDEALLCLYCGESLKRAIGTSKIIIVSISVLILVSFIILITR
jgi:DNA-directed RNA polymerase subunit RPC12/RpoP